MSNLLHFQLIPEDLRFPYASNLIEGDTVYYSMQFLKNLDSFEVLDNNRNLVGKTYTTTKGSKEIHLLNPERIISVEKPSFFSHDRTVVLCSGNITINPRNNFQRLAAWNIDLFFWSKSYFSQLQLIARGSVGDFENLDMPLLCSLMYILYSSREWTYPVG